MKTGIKIALSIALLSSLSFGGEQFAMSDSDRAMYAEMLEIIRLILWLRMVMNFFKSSVVEMQV